MALPNCDNPASSDEELEPAHDTSFCHIAQLRKVTTKSPNPSSTLCTSVITGGVIAIILFYHNYLCWLRSSFTSTLSGQYFKQTDHRRHLLQYICASCNWRFCSVNYDKLIRWRVCDEQHCALNTSDRVVVLAQVQLDKNSRSAKSVS
uniref:Uncharacterized protein n=1 Tax=Glossina austeni TaxID=7395 RepID=A0A1A9URX0_GLOAU